MVGQWWVGRSTRFAHKVVRRSHWYADRFTKNDGKTHLGSGALVREKHACVGHDVFFSTDSTPTVSHDTTHTTHTTQTDVPCPRCTPAVGPPWLLVTLGSVPKIALVCELRECNRAGVSLLRAVTTPATAKQGFDLTPFTRHKYPRRSTPPVSTETRTQTTCARAVTKRRRVEEKSSRHKTSNCAECANL